MQPDFVKVNDDSCHDKYINRNLIVYITRSNRNETQDWIEFRIILNTITEYSHTFTYKTKEKRDEIFTNLLTGDKQS